MRVTVTTHTDRALRLRTIWTVHPLLTIYPYIAHGKIYHCSPLYRPIHNFVHFKGSDNKIRTKIYAYSTVIHQCTCHVTRVTIIIVRVSETVCM